jgi:hypothetical protein
MHMRNRYADIVHNLIKELFAKRAELKLRISYMHLLISILRQKINLYL